MTRPDAAASTMRVSDAERAEVSNLLCRHFGDGRLDEGELNERLARTAAAKTRADLKPLLADLPGFASTLSAHAPRRRRVPGVALVAGLVVLVVWSTTGVVTTILHPHVRWILVAIVVVVLLRRPRRHVSG